MMTGAASREPPKGVTMMPALAEGALQAWPASAVSTACPHFPRCPAAAASDGDAARTVAAHPEQGWSLLCNGIVLFDDTGELLPDGRALPPRVGRIYGGHAA
jgi:hypothetical protein